ncbi:hypothetical protein NE237_022764 [Protea cynaroides]|uniref:Uncharacterized protein n=1 Tax=Protea cynaroides TaxID=273540 RepID=A0A9Q0K5K6_9MAGN|nr:hypothetical protein NE237_022764 [Protea cynaroides]
MLLPHVDASEEAPLVPVTEDEADSADDEQESSSHAAGGDEIPIVVVPQARASEFIELHDLLADAWSLVAALGDHQCSLQTRLNTHKRRMLQNITGVEQRVIIVERSIIQFQSLEEAKRNEVAFLSLALTSMDIILRITDDVVATAIARPECSRWRRLQAMTLVRATYSVDSP